MNDHLDAIREALEEFVRKRDPVPQPAEEDFANLDAYHSALAEWLASRSARRDAALSDDLRGAFRNVEDLTAFFANPPDVLARLPLSPEPPLVPSEAGPVVQPEGIRNEGLD